MKVAADLSIGLFENKELTAFSLGYPQKREAYSICEGQSCNCQVIDNFIPHIHGTHTETIHHVYQVRSISSTNIVRSIPFLMDFSIVDHAQFKNLKGNKDSEALIIKFNNLPPYQSELAHMKPSDIDCILENFPKVQHLLVDLPSIDACNDSNLTCHKKFFDKVPNGTITEICNFSDLQKLKEGYKLHLSIFPIFDGDAHPSRPLIIQCE
jgi:hypothetical protein